MKNYTPTKYSIAQCLFPIIKHRDTDADVTFIGIFELTDYGLLSAEYSMIGKIAHLGSAISVGSIFPGGCDFPKVEDVFDIMSEDHSDFIDAFLKTIPQKGIILFDDGERYAVAMMTLIAQQARKCGKQVTCVSARPPKFQGRRCREDFEYFWEEIESIANEAIVYDLEYINDDSKVKENGSVAYTMKVRQYEIWKNIYNMWKKINKQ